jgi:hypothetical protein
MIHLHRRVAVAALLTLIALPAARRADKVLVSGDPPLTSALLEMNNRAME